MTFCYPNSQLLFDDLSFEIGKREKVGFFGRNGTGKTTMVKLLLGILKPIKGEIYLEDKPITKLSLTEIGRKVGYVYQNPDNQLFTPTVYEQVAFGLRMQGADEEELKQITMEWLEFFELEVFKERFPFNLSRGQKQRVVLSSIFARGADFFIMDEPTVGLDMIMLEKLDKILNNLKKSEKGFIIVSHEIDFLKRHTDRLLQFTENGVEFFD